jgi:16S rRNA (uracil1498-N3)-methyltransferase
VGGRRPTGVIRVFSPEPLSPGQSRVALTAEERHHLAVRRVAPHQPIEVLDGLGSVGRGRWGGREADPWVDLTEVVRVARPPELALLVGAGDRERFGWLVEKAQELGATHVVPLVTERTRGVATGLSPAHLERLARRAVQAMKQAGTAWRLEIGPLSELATALPAVAARVRWLADPTGQPPGPVGAADAVAVLIGPEGGFTERERARAMEHRFTPLKLGSGVLRFETAALAAAAVISALRGRVA